MPIYLMHMLKEYVKAWECRWKLENLYDLRVLLEDWKICFIPLLNPDGYEIYEKDFYAIRNPIYRQMLRMQEIPCKEFICNSRGVNLRKISRHSTTEENKFIVSRRVKMKQKHL